MKPFSPNAHPTVGIEQEFHLVDPMTGQMKGCVDEVFARLNGEQRKLVTYELYEAVLESQSRVCKTIGELYEDIAATRQLLDSVCRQVGVRLVSAGCHPFADWRKLKIVSDPHYQWVREHCRYIVQRMMAFGLHVHVGMRSIESAMYSMNEMRRWLYPLMALSVNSPFFEGSDTGLATIRAHLFGSMPRSHMPPYFRTFAELETHFEKLLATGSVTGPSELWWAIRPQPALGTIEVRVYDLPTDTKRLCVLTALTQAAAAFYQDRFFAGDRPAVLEDAYMEQNRWNAMRFGPDCKMIEPETGEVLETKAYLRRLFDLIEAKAEELGSAEYIKVARGLLETETESQWQRRRLAELGGDMVALELELAQRTLL